MNGNAPHPQQSTIDIQQLARAIRFALVSIVLGLSYFSLRSSLAIENFEAIFHDMLGGRPLPALTVFVIRARDVFVGVSILVPIAAMATLFLRRVVGSLYVIGALGIVTIIQFIVLYHGLTAPIDDIIKAMSGESTR